MSGALAGWLVLKPGGQSAAAWAGVVGNILGPLLGLFWWATAGRSGQAGGADAQRNPGWCRQSLSWLLFGLSILAFLLGQLVFYYYDRVLGEPPFPSLADPFFLAAYPLQIAAVLLLPGIRGRSGLGTGRLVLDSLITVGALATFSWFFLLGPVLAQGSLSPPAKALLTAYPVMDLAVLFCLALATGGGGARARAVPGVAMIGAGLLTLVVGDTVFAYQNLHGTYVTGTLNDLTWPLGYLLLGLGAAGLRRRRTDAAAPDEAAAPVLGRDAALSAPAAFWHAVLPYALLPAVSALLVYAHTSGATGVTHRGVEVGCGVIVLLIVLRQVLSIAENARLNRELRAALNAGRESHRALTLACDTLRDSEQRFRIACQSAGDLVYEWTIDSRQLEWFGDVDRALGYGPGEFPRTIDAWERVVHPDDRERVLGQLDRHLAGGEPFACEYRVVTRDGRVLCWVERGSAIRDEAGRAVRMIGAIGDVTSRKLAEQRLRHDSLHDALTGLPNRVLFLDRVEQCIRRARRAGQGYHFAVVFLDLDRFKVINDSLGHAAGDRLLIEVSRRLQASLREYDAVSRDVIESEAHVPQETAEETAAVARLGGDEFTILLDGLRAPADAVGIAERIQADLARPIDFEGHELVTSASIGIILGTSQYEAAKDLLRDADAAMYRAKQSGRARHVVFDASMHAEAVERLRTEGALRRALDRRELVLHYQPIADLTTGGLVGFEALARWRRDGRLVPPAEFLPVAEDMGLIVAIGNWVIGEACRQLAEWRGRQGARAAALTMNVNLSRKQLADPQIVEHCRRTLAEHRLAPESLKLEITESVIVEDRVTATEALGALKRLGVKLEIDDFGTGYSSLSCLHEFPLDGLKIDREFAFSAAERDNMAIVHAIIHLAHNLRMEVVAEGIETREQLALLQSLDCDAGQGLLFSGPLDAAAAERFIASTPPGTSVGRRLSA